MFAVVAELPLSTLKRVAVQTINYTAMGKGCGWGAGGVCVTGLVFWQPRSLGNLGKSCPSAQPHRNPEVRLGGRLRVGERGLSPPGSTRSRGTAARGGGTALTETPSLLQTFQESHQHHSPSSEHGRDPQELQPRGQDPSGLTGPQLCHGPSPSATDPNLLCL